MKLGCDIQLKRDCDCLRGRRSSPLFSYDTVLNLDGNQGKPFRIHDLEFIMDFILSNSYFILASYVFS